MNIGHGHVFPRSDGVRMRCGAERMCSVCKHELLYKDAGYTELPEDYETHTPASQHDTGKVVLDLTLFIRLLEIAREELKTDADLHYLVDRVTTAQTHSPTLTMSNYAEIMPEAAGVGNASSEDVASLAIEQQEDAAFNAVAKKLVADDTVSENITLSGSAEAVDRVKALLAMVSLNGNWGHSGVFAISWDGDGQDKIDVSFDTEPYRDLVQELGAYGGPVEMVGDNRTGFIGRPAKDGTPYINYKKVFPVETKINAAVRLNKTSKE